MNQRACLFRARLTKLRFEQESTAHNISSAKHLIITCDARIPSAVGLFEKEMRQFHLKTVVIPQVVFNVFRCVQVGAAFVSIYPDCDAILRVAHWTCIERLQGIILGIKDQRAFDKLCCIKISILHHVFNVLAFVDAVKVAVVVIVQASVAAVCMGWTLGKLYGAARFLPGETTILFGVFVFFVLVLFLIMVLLLFVLLVFVVFFVAVPRISVHTLLMSNRAFFAILLEKVLVVLHGDLEIRI